MAELSDSAFSVANELDDSAFTPQPEQKSSTARRVLGDTGISLLKGAVSVPEAAVGVADIFTGGKAGDLLRWNMQQCQFFTDLL